LARSKTIFSLLLVAALAGSSVARADLAEWDQAKVTAAADGLVKATVVLRDSLRQKVPPTLGQPGRRALFTFQDEVRALATASARLHRSLADGNGMDETYPIFRRIVRTGRRAQRETRRIGVSETTGNNIDAVADLIRKLRPFYEPEPPI
jgi:hypothetical protein